MKTSTKFFLGAVGFFAVIMLIIPSEETTDQTPVKKEIIQEPVQDVKYNKNDGALVKSFAYSLQAGLMCDDLKMRLDTENKIKDKIGTDTRQGTYNKDYMQGLNIALSDNEKGLLCKEAWSHFGCSGDIEANLLQQNPMTNPNAELCQY